MVVSCDFYGSYYDADPWTHQACMVDVAVPEGCPIHFVAAAPIDPTQITAQRSAANGTVIDTPSTATIIASDQVTFSVMDVSSCDCHQTNIGVEFDHLEVDVPAARAGETVYLQGIAFQSGSLAVQIDPSGPCPAPEWPTEYHAAIACDVCPDPDSDDDGATDSDDNSAGCAVGGDPSVILVGLALLPFVRRRQRAAHSGSSDSSTRLS